MAIEDHGAGRQYLRFKLWPRCPAILVVAALTGVLAAGAAVSGAAATAAVIGAIGAALAARTLAECSMAETALLDFLEELSL